MVIGGGLNLQKLSLFAIYAPLPTHSDTYGNSVYVLDIAQEILAYNFGNGFKASTISLMTLFINQGVSPQNFSVITFPITIHVLIRL